jgi:hypothetical protein
MIIAGVNPVTGFVYDPSKEADPHERHGGPADPYHGQFGERAKPYPWEEIPNAHYQINPVPGMVEDDYNPDWGLPAGLLGQDPTGDQTPAYNAAPFPREGPGSKAADQLDVAGRREGSTRQLIESASIHASRTGAGLKRLFLPQMLAKQDQWDGFFNPVTGEDQVPKIPGHIGTVAFGYNVNDHVSNSYAKINNYGFNTSHRHRRVARGPIPGNFLWLKARGRPLVRSFTGNYNFQTSGPFQGDNPGASFTIDGAVLQNTPTNYTPPPQVTLANSSNDASVPEISFW